MIAERVYHCAAGGSGSLVLHKGPASAHAWGRCLQPSIAMSKGKSERHVNHTPTRKPPFFRSFFVDFFFLFFSAHGGMDKRDEGGKGNFNAPREPFSHHHHGDRVRHSHTRL